jgi:hypothetical protein
MGLSCFGIEVLAVNSLLSTFDHPHHHLCFHLPETECHPAITPHVDCIFVAFFAPASAVILLAALCSTCVLLQLLELQGWELAPGLCENASCMPNHSGSPCALTLLPRMLCCRAGLSVWAALAVCLCLYTVLAIVHTRYKRPHACNVKFAASKRL